MTMEGTDGGIMSMFDQDLYDILFHGSSGTNIKKKESEENCQNDEKREKDLTIAELENNVRRMEQQAYNPSWREIPRFRKPFGRIAQKIKRVIRKLTKFYIEPFSEQQNMFNDATTKAVSGLEKLANTTEISILAIKEVQASQNYQIMELDPLKSELTEKASVSDVEALKSELTEKTNAIDSSILAMEEVQASQNYQITVLNEMKSELEEAFSRISEMEDCAKELKEISTSSNVFATLSYAQSGEDQIIQYILKYLGISVSSVRYLDLGANHAKEISNTYSFYRQGARGVLLEANPKLIPELNLYRSEDEIIPKCLVSDPKIKTIPFYILNGDGLSSFDKKTVEDAIAQNPELKIEAVEEVKTITMNEIIDTYFPTAPTILNIDIEGSEEEIIASIDFGKWRPLVIIIETIPYHPHLVYDEKRDNLVNQLIEKDYTEYAFTGINSIMLDRKQLK